MTTQSTSDRLDRVERILEQIAERQEQADQRQERTDQQLNLFIVSTDKMIGRNAEQIGQLVNEMNFLRTAVQGHITDATAHSAD